MSAGIETGQSFFGWVDYNDHDAQQMREMIEAFDEKDTVDSLGIGVIRDAIADHLFPGISITQTRARYFFFVPWICQILEAEQVPEKKFDARLRELEVALIESLRTHEGPNQGVIGYRARDRLNRLPSSIYWNGLGVFGIRCFDMPLSRYRACVARFGLLYGAELVDDDGETVIERSRLWDPALPLAPEGFPHEPVSLRLTRDEADYLAERFMTARPDSMLAALVRDLNADRSALRPWDVPLTHTSPNLAKVLDHARNFSQLMYGAQLLYNHLLAQHAQQLLGRDRDALLGELDVEDALGRWAKEMTKRRDELTSWLTSCELWPIVEQNSPVPIRTRRFVEEWARLALDRPHQIIRDSRAKQLITERERQLKGKLARLSERRALEHWKGEPLNAAPMTFRWSTAKRIVDDLTEQ